MNHHFTAAVKADGISASWRSLGAVSDLEIEIERTIEESPTGVHQTKSHRLAFTLSSAAALRRFRSGKQWLKIRSRTGVTLFEIWAMVWTTEGNKTIARSVYRAA